mmetsp:Transcript_22552/g.36116  ORF Transcript_22552/g.36116 Transcript_22552/m.36116 type:complete len:214 (+) Transcript_22552:25-666(+)
MPPLQRRPPGARLPLGLAVAALCMLFVGGAAGERRQQPVEGEEATTQQKPQRTTVLLSEAQRQRIDRAFSRASWQSLDQTPAAATRRRSSSTAKVKKVVAKLQNLLGQAAQVHAYGNVYRPYGDQWRGRKSVLHPEVDRNGEKLTDESGNVEDALSLQTEASAKAMAPSGAGGSMRAAPAAAYTRLPPCNAGGGAVVYSSNCAPYPYGGLPMF